MKTLLLITALLASTAALAANGDHTIKPNCWDENVNGETQHHCEVERPQAAPNHAPHGAPHGRPYAGTVYPYGPQPDPYLPGVMPPGAYARAPYPNSDAFYPPGSYYGPRPYYWSGYYGAAYGPG
jgi:hypothetical protein